MEDYYGLLHQKMSDEFYAYKDKLRTLSIDEIIEHSYETVMKEDILACFESPDLDLSNKEAKALYRMKEPLDACFRQWQHNDMSYMDMLIDTIEDCAVVEARHMKMEEWRER